MLSENLKRLRMQKGLSQEELASKLNVVRQTVSKWEKGLSVPDCQMLICIAEALDTSVSVLLDDAPEVRENEELRVIAAKLEVLNQQFAQRNENRRRAWRIAFIILGILTALYLLYHLVVIIYTQVALAQLGNDIAIIGGADGPTAIFVSSDFKLLPGVIALIAAITSVIGICKTRKD